MSSQISSIVSKVQDNVDQIDDSVMSLHDLYTKLYVIHHTEDHSLLDHKHQQLKEILTEEDITQELLDELLTSVQADNISNILQKSNTISEDQPHETTAPQTAQPTATTSGNKGAHTVKISNTLYDTYNDNPLLVGHNEQLDIYSRYNINLPGFDLNSEGLIVSDQMRNYNEFISQRKPVEIYNSQGYHTLSSTATIMRHDGELYELGENTQAICNYLGELREGPSGEKAYLCQMNIDYQNEYVFIIKDGTAPMQRLGRSQNMSSISVQKKETIATPRQPQTNPQTRSASVKQTTPLEQPISTPSSESELLPVPTVITELPDDRVADERITPPAETTIVAIQPVSIRDQATYTRFSSIYGGDELVATGRTQLVDTPRSGVLQLVEVNFKGENHRVSGSKDFVKAKEEEGEGEESAETGENTQQRLPATETGQPTVRDISSSDINRDNEQLAPTASGTYNQIAVNRSLLSPQVELPEIPTSENQSPANNEIETNLSRQSTYEHVEQSDIESPRLPLNNGETHLQLVTGKSEIYLRDAIDPTKTNGTITQGTKAKIIPDDMDSHIVIHKGTNDELYLSKVIIDGEEYYMSRSSKWVESTLADEQPNSVNTSIESQKLGSGSLEHFPKILTAAEAARIAALPTCPEEYKNKIIRIDTKHRQEIAAGNVSQNPVNYCFVHGSAADNVGDDKVSTSLIRTGAEQSLYPRAITRNGCIFEFFPDEGYGHGAIGGVPGSRNATSIEFACRTASTTNEFGNSDVEPINAAQTYSGQILLSHIKQQHNLPEDNIGSSMVGVYARELGDGTSFHHDLQGKEHDAARAALGLPKERDRLIAQEMVST